MFSRRSIFVTALAAPLALGLYATGINGANAEERFITVASTTSTVDTGLFDHLIPMFSEETGIEVRVISQGTGQALDTGRRGDADVLFVHSRPAEEEFVADGYGVKRNPVMYNDFVIIGPDADPAGARDEDAVTGALSAIALAQVPFVSRGDDSGTHQAELRLWKAAGIDPALDKIGWYREIGQGMGAALNTASGMDAYVMSDRGTWLSFQNRGDLAIVFEGDEKLFNQYGIILVNPERHDHVKADDAQAFIDWVISPEGQSAIADFKIDGEQLFFPNAGAEGV